MAKARAVLAKARRADVMQSQIDADDADVTAVNQLVMRALGLVSLAEHRSSNIRAAGTAHVSHIIFVHSLTRSNVCSFYLFICSCIHAVVISFIKIKNTYDVQSIFCRCARMYREW